MAALERQLANGDKALVGNTGFRRYLKTISEEHFAIDPDALGAASIAIAVQILANLTVEDGLDRKPALLP